MPCLSCSTFHPTSSFPSQVKDWAGGQASDIGELKVVPGSLGTGFSTAGGSKGAAPAAVDTAVPFFQQLGEHAQYLEVR